MNKVFLLSVFITLNGLTHNIYPKNEKYIETKKKGYSMGVLPAIGYNSDIGFRYGILGNIYDYGDGSSYPNYKQSLFLEWSKTTKGNSINRITYDTRTLIPATKMVAEISYITEKALDFYGFNGYQQRYYPEYTNENSPNYRSRMYYAHGRSVLKISADFQSNKDKQPLKWLTGIAYLNTKNETVDIDKLNEGQKSNLLPKTDLLYDKYKQWNIIPSQQADGGQIAYLKAGAVYDTRDNEANPLNGIWSEASLISAIGVGNTDAKYIRLHSTHRHYIPIYHRYLTLAYRISYQTTIAGSTPYYMLPYSIDSYSTEDGIGSSKTVRGILRNRIVGDGIAYANIELRSRVWETVLWKQNLYLGINGFFDMGMVTKKIQFDTTNIPAKEKNNLFFGKERPHASIGIGVRIALNNNFVVAIDYGHAFSSQDGTNGLYIGLGYLF